MVPQFVLLQEDSEKLLDSSCKSNYFVASGCPNLRHRSELPTTGVSGIHPFFFAFQARLVAKRTSGFMEARQCPNQRKKAQAHGSRSVQVPTRRSVTVWSCPSSSQSWLWHRSTTAASRSECSRMWPWRKSAAGKRDTPCHFETWNHRLFSSKVS